MKKVVFICPYFGKLPKEQTQLWLKTCAKNPSVDWIIMTDDKTDYLYPSNVKIIYTTIKKLRKRIQEKFDFKISLESGYKMCDFRPTYGYVFEDLLKGYDYWGHCDLSDSIFGNIEKCLGGILDKGFDKIGFLGNLTLYKNTNEVNKRFLMESKAGRSLKDILGAMENQAFDETFDYSIDHVFIDNGFEIKRIDDLYADISTKKWPFRRALWSENFEWLRLLKEKYIFEWDNGSLYKISIEDGEIAKKEIVLVHYQKRKIKYEIDINNTEHFYLVPNAFIEYRPLSSKEIKEYTKDKIINPVSLDVKIKKIKKRIGK